MTVMPITVVETLSDKYSLSRGMSLRSVKTFSNKKLTFKVKSDYKALEWLRALLNSKGGGPVGRRVVHAPAAPEPPHRVGLVLAVLGGEAAVPGRGAAEQHRLQGAVRHVGAPGLPGRRAEGVLVVVQVVGVVVVAAGARVHERHGGPAPGLARGGRGRGRRLGEGHGVAPASRQRRRPVPVVVATRRRRRGGRGEGEGRQAAA